MMDEASALEEMKRVDHLIFVTLKYTRTVDIIRNVVQRLVSAMECQINDTVTALKKSGKILAMPLAPLMKCQVVDKTFSKDKTVRDFVDFYYNLRKISQSEFKKKEEYRKNVAMVTAKEEIDIEKLKDYAEKTKKYINYLRELIELR